MVQNLTMRSPLIFLTQRLVGYVPTPSLTCSSENRTPEVAFWKETERNLIYTTSGIYTVHVFVSGSFHFVGTGKRKDDNREFINAK